MLMMKMMPMKMALIRKVLIRHMQAWFAQRGDKVPDESTLKRRLRDIWVTFRPEAKQRGRD
jgi:hypothetical protein